MCVRVLPVATAIAMAAVVTAASNPVEAATIGFFNISDNSGVADDVEDQLSVDVSLTGDRAKFTFANNVGIPSSITDIYFDDDASLLESIYSISDRGDGVSFSEGAAPGNLPGGNAYNFKADFSLDSDAPGVPHNGINSALESVSIVFNLVKILSLTELVNAILAGDLRIGLHVQAINRSGSDGFISGPGGFPSPVPVPAGLVLFLSGLFGIGVLGRLKSKQSGSALEA